MFLIAFKSASGGITVVSPANPLPVTGGGGGGGGDVNIVSIGGNPVTTAIPISSTAIGAGSDAVGANTVIGQLKEVNETAGAIADAAYDGTTATTAQGYLRRIADEMLDAGPAATFGEAPSWIDIAANQSNVAVGNANDLLDSLLITPLTKSPGAVSIGDGATATVVKFQGGTDSVSTLIPWSIDMRNVAAVTQHRVTTGADVTVRAFYRART